MSIQVRRQSLALDRALSELPIVPIEYRINLARINYEIVQSWERFPMDWEYHGIMRALLREWTRNYFQFISN